MIWCVRNSTGLPASFEVAWGLREPPTRGPKRGLSLWRIVDATVRIADGEGLAAVSMGRIAAELGCGTMSLYRYVSTKEELLALMVDAAIGPPPQTAPGEGWRAGLARWAWGERAILQRHPWMVRVLVRGGPPVTPNHVAWMDAGLRCLSETRLTEGDKLEVILLVSGLVQNDVTLALDFAAAGPAAQAAMASYGRTLAKLIDAERFPALHRAVASGELDDGDADLDASFRFGLERVLDGIEVLMRRGATPDRPPSEHALPPS